MAYDTDLNALQFCYGDQSRRDNLVYVAATVCSVAQLYLTLCDPLGLSQQEYWSGLPFPPLGDLPDPGIKPESSAPPSTGRWILYHWANWQARICILHCKRTDSSLHSAGDNCEGCFNMYNVVCVCVCVCVYVFVCVCVCVCVSNPLNEFSTNLSSLRIDHSILIYKGKGQLTKNLNWSVLLLLLLSCFSRVWLCATPQMTAH